MATEQEVKDELIKDLKMSNERALDQLRLAHMEQLKQAQMHARERNDELVKQNDGLLGAVGRLQGERDEAVKKCEDQEREMRRRDLEIQMKVQEVNIQMDLQRSRERDMAEKVKIKAEEERQALKAEIVKLKAKLEKKRGK